MINIKLLSDNQKQQINGGSFYAVALGVGILVSTAASLIANIVDICHPNNTATTYGTRRSGVAIRLSPVPTRSSVTIF